MAPSSSPHPPMVLCTAESFPALNESGRREEICAWLRVNGIEPNDVSADAPITVEDENGQLVIRYSAFLLTDDGHKYEDPNCRNQVAREERTAPCVVEPPAYWALGDEAP